MKNLLEVAAIAALLLLPACAGGHARWEPDSATTARSLEVQVDGMGRHTEVEYHVSPDAVPAVVRRAMDQLHPGGPYDDAEKESHKGKVYWELSRKVNGMAVEAMFTEDGTLFEEEIQVPMNKVPEVVRDRAMASLGGATATKWEEIRNAKREVVAYHVKMSRGGDKYKVMLGKDGKVEGIVREVPAEIEVPVR
jgi:hypothetical protein